MWWCLTEITKLINGKLSRCLSSLVPRLIFLPCGAPHLDPPKKLPSLTPASVPHTAPEGASHPQLQPEKNALTLPVGALARRALAEERRLSQHQAGRGSSRRPRPTGQAHRAGWSQTQRGQLLPTPHHETLPPACLGTRQPG